MIKAIVLLALPCLLMAEEPGRVRQDARLHPSIPIRVLLDKQLKSVTLEGKEESLWQLVGREWKDLGKRVTVKLAAGGSRVLINGKPDEEKVLVFRPGLEGTGTVRYNGRVYRGSMRVVVGDGKLLLVNSVPLEQYLVSTVGAEMSRSWELEALKAQSVASRTYAFYMIRNPRSKNYDVEATIHDQVYDGKQPKDQRIREVVEATSGQYLTTTTTRDKEMPPPLHAFFHSRCGGTTELASAIWRGATRKDAGVPCPYCQKASHSWSAEVPVAKVLEAVDMKEASGPIAIDAAKRTPTGRINVLRISAGGKTRTINADKFRRLVGYQTLPSSQFTWEIGPTAVVFKGTGAGHGVGMCQWGARRMAQQGKTYREILEHFYPGSVLYGAPSNVSSLKVAHPRPGG